ncbi:MAG: ribosome recycling factor [Spirochaetales bacterium]|nr:ribosome recycling factor [Spirochaetales bacterium]
MDQVNKNAESKMKKAIAAMQEDFQSIRTGRASSALFEKILVDYYGTKTPLKQMANISIPEARLVVIQPFDRTALGEIEKAIQKSELSVNPNNDGKVIRIAIPPLTEDRRKELVKLTKTKAENARVSIRNIRRDANEELKKMQKNSEISEDDSKRGIDEVQKLTDKYIEEVNKLLEAKEAEILEV